MVAQASAGLGNRAMLTFAFYQRKVGSTGLTTIRRDLSLATEPPAELFLKLVAEHEVPVARQFELWCQLRVCANPGPPMVELRLV